MASEASIIAEQDTQTQWKNYSVMALTTKMIKIHFATQVRLRVIELKNSCRHWFSIQLNDRVARCSFYIVHIIIFNGLSEHAHDTMMRCLCRAPSIGRERERTATDLRQSIISFTLVFCILALYGEPFCIAECTGIQYSSVMAWAPVLAGTKTKQYTKIMMITYFSANNSVQSGVVVTLMACD